MFLFIKYKLCWSVEFYNVFLAETAFSWPDKINERERENL